MAVLSSFSTADVTTAWRGLGHGEIVIWGWSEHHVCGVKEFYIPEQEKIMFAVDSALCGFQMFIYSGYTLRPFIIIIIVLKNWHSLELFIAESKQRYIDILT